MPIETLDVEEHIYSLLSTDATLQALLDDGVPVFNRKVPQGTPAPYIVISPYDSNDANANDGEHIFSMNQYQVVVLTKNEGPLSVKSIVNRMDFLLRKTPATELNHTYIGHFMRERIVNMEISDTDDDWYQIGGIYRGMAHPLSFSGDVEVSETLTISDETDSSVV